MRWLALVLVVVGGCPVDDGESARRGAGEVCEVISDQEGEDERHLCASGLECAVVSQGAGSVAECVAPQGEGGDCFFGSADRDGCVDGLVCIGEPDAEADLTGACGAPAEEGELCRDGESQHPCDDGLDCLPGSSPSSCVSRDDPRCDATQNCFPNLCSPLTSTCVPAACADGCALGYACDEASQTCVLAQPECDDDDDCAGDLVCFHFSEEDSDCINHCGAPPDGDDVCTRVSDEATCSAANFRVSCAPDLECVVVESDVSQVGTCERKQFAGGPCVVSSPESDGCADGLTCTEEGDGSFFCR